MRLQVPLRVYSADSKLIATIGETRRIPIKIEQVPPQLKNAFLAAEDANFYSHPGVDWQGMARAVGLMISQTHHARARWQHDHSAGRARIFLELRSAALTRKFTEIFLAFRIERELTKDEIFELYLNKIFFGNRAYGVAAAAEFYYGKTLDQLDAGRGAMLASLPKFPSSSNPLSNRARATERRKYVLQRMLDNGFITADQFKQADAEPDRSYAHEPPIEVEAPWIAEMVRQDVLDKLGNEALTDGYSVYTTLDAHDQDAANQALARRSDQLTTSATAFAGRKRTSIFPSIRFPTDLDKELDAFHPIVGLIPGIVTESCGEICRTSICRTVKPCHSTCPLSCGRANTRTNAITAGRPRR